MSEQPQDESKDPAAAFTLKDLYDHHYHEVRPHASPHTHSDYETTLRHWKKYTANPKMGVLASQEKKDRRRFRIILQRFHGDLQTFGGMRETTANKYLRCVMALLNIAGPNGKGNPNGLDILPWVPALPRGTTPDPAPRQIEGVSLEAIYHACVMADWPTLRGVEPVDWWRALLVFLTLVGYRRSDWWNSLCWSDLSLDEGWVEKVERKTGKRERKPLFDCVVWHLRQFQTHRKYVFQSPKSKKRLYPQWNAIQREAGIPEPLYLFKDLRSTCGDNFYQIEPSLGQAALSHSSVAVTMRHYANPKRQRYEALKAAEDKLEIPPAFLKFAVVSDDAG